MVSPQNIPVNRGDAVTPVSSSVATTGRGLVHPEESALYVPEGTIPMPRSYVTWGSVIAGTLATLSILALLAALGYAVTVSMYSGNANAGPSDRNYTIGAAIWAALSCIVAFWAGGCVSAYMSSGVHNSRHALLHGVMVWALALPLIGVLAGVAQNRGMILGDLGRMTMRSDIAGVNPDVGAAWASFAALALGLIFAAVGGLSAIPLASRILRTRSSTDTGPIVEQRPA